VKRHHRLPSFTLLSHRFAQLITRLRNPISPPTITLPDFSS
jgi:hypothetical protein